MIYDPQLAEAALALLQNNPIGLLDAHIEQLQIVGGDSLAERALAEQRRATLALLPKPAPVITKAAPPRPPRVFVRDPAAIAAVVAASMEHAIGPIVDEIADLKQRLKACDVAPDPIAAARRVVSARFDAAAERQATAFTATLRGVPDTTAAALRQLNADHLVAAKRRLLDHLPGWLHDGTIH